MALTQLTTASEKRLLWRYSIPAITGMLVQSLYNIIDRIFVAHIPQTGTQALAAVGVAFPVMTFISAIGLWFGVGGRVVLSQLLGQKKKQQAEQLMASLVKKATGIALMVTVIGCFFLRPLLSLCGANAMIMPEAIAYLRLILIAAPMNLVGFMLTKWISTDGQPQRTLLLQVLSTIINVIAAPILIFWCHLGIVGAALATIIAQLFLLLGALQYFCRSHQRTMTLSFRHTTPVTIQAVMKIGFPSFMMQLLACTVQLLCNVQLQAKGGHLAVGAMAIVQSVSLLFTQPMFGLSQGMQPLVSYNQGAHQPQRVHRFLRLSLCWVSLWSVFGWLVVEGAPQIIVPLFTTNHDIQRLAVIGLRLFLLALFVDGIQIIITSYYQAIGNHRASFWLSILRQGFCFIPLVLILPSVLGMTGIFISGGIADSLAFFITMGYVGICHHHSRVAHHPTGKE